MSRSLVVICSLAALSCAATHRPSGPVNRRPAASMASSVKMVADTLSASEARRLDSLATVTCVIDAADRAGLMPWISLRIPDFKNEVLQFRQHLFSDSSVIFMVSISVDTDSVRVWEGGRVTKFYRAYYNGPMRLNALCRRERTGVSSDDRSDSHQQQSAPRRQTR